MPSSCKDIRLALAQCLQESDCIMVQRNTPRECLREPHLDQLPVKCQQLRKGLSECKRGMVDMRKRFRGNAPVSLTKETDADTGEVVEKRTPVPQLYAGKPAVQSIKQTSGDEAQMDPEKTRGL
ncbi:hypothetical protein D8B26_006061 [Coccidioides posadasii str. Silveira]|uniref:Cytochrome c oxidase assembly protein n=3 Tax=Coccidioides posadasii TaxID=199306 RepID=E9DBT9_COCPS|nr:PET191 protein, mitochondrial precursor, putative [Coccidioides posadasii C735 delta SOWgp]EER27827.1 PET191 protein, mitochondrial precursor, putative [Coccidioides posadasii C735 delta SOWgp]EFW16241.1 cytochrome c oxidase assembly protein [Coccidioides posadasii str. Silveira]KMM67755.1 hypothetical protein CPAG_04088 [Coccidioides posadasii RMSCC 3488]QVM11413.1 hypothetical protein D8B26_006061 [Coccidioides posadasii str. Silveira]|eukprot:XP_003069972.1 PET191 protein, mitochondrial precursor, putative [Coccidioides posadasii C735 delta SOWgp]